MMNAIPYGYDHKVTININLFNPKDNWGEIGLKLKTFEIFEDEDGKETEYLVDQLEGNQLIPNLKCLAPCSECKSEKMTMTCFSVHLAGRTTLSNT